MIAVVLLNWARRFLGQVASLGISLTVASGLGAEGGEKTSLLPAPTFSVAGGVFTNDVTLKL